MCKICHILSLFVAIATRIFNIGRKKNVHNFHTAIYPYIKFHKNIFSTFQVIAGSSFVDGRTDRQTDGRIRKINDPGRGQYDLRAYNHSLEDVSYLISKPWVFLSFFENIFLIFT
jgi:hypothetical protein